MNSDKVLSKGEAVQLYDDRIVDAVLRAIVDDGEKLHGSIGVSLPMTSVAGPAGHF